MTRIFYLTISIMWISACNSASHAETKKELVVGGVVVTPPANDTTIVVRTKDSVYTVTFKNKVITATKTTATGNATAIVVPGDTTKPATTRKNLLLESTFEGVDYLAGWNNKGSQRCPDASWAISQSSDFARAGKSSARFELRRTDCDAAGSKRTEITQDPESSEAVERWYGISYYFPDDFIKDPAHDVIFQWHHSGSTGSPPLSLRVKDDNLNITQTMGGQRFNHTIIAPVTRGKWTDVVFHVKFSTDTDGLVEVWVNGDKVYTKTGVNNFDENYLKMGIYKSQWKSDPAASTTTKRIIYVDEVRIGNENATYDDVKP